MKIHPSFLVLALLLTCTLTLVPKVQPLGASGTIFIRADGSIDPPTAPISTLDNITYTLTGNITSDADGIKVERDSIIIDGNGYTLQGVGIGIGFGLDAIDFVEVKNMSIKGFQTGIRLVYASDNIISGNNITNNVYGASLMVSYYNFFYHNNFVNNANNIDDQNQGDAQWDDGYLSGGNYWSDYEGVDEKSGPYQNQTGNDGIGDTPMLRAGALDRYPLMSLWTPTSSKSYVIRVPTDLPTIQEAIEVAGIDYPIFVYSGTYQEQLVISKPLLLIGEQPLTTIIDGGGQDNVITILANNVVIQNFTIRNSAYATYGRMCAGICIDRSTMPGSQRVCNNVLIGNIITDNSGDGIAFYYGFNNTILGNTITNNVRSIFLYGSSNNSIIGNTITNNNYYGIALGDNSDYNTISGNNLIGNRYGIYFSYFTDYNKFYHNNFIENSQQVEFHPQSGYTNFCDNEYPSGGNYWSDYSGTDANHDGIGDTPYVIDANNTDHYPLITTIPEFPSFLILPLFLVATLLAVTVYKRKTGVSDVI